MRLFLVRHGQTAWNVEWRAQGHTDIPLDETGEEQARLLGCAFDGHGAMRIISSDLRRSAKTAEAVGENVELDPRLRERSFGSWEGLGFAELRERKAELALQQDLALEEVIHPGGESIVMVWNRLEAVAAELIGSTGDTMVVTHGGSCALLLSHLILGDWHTARAFRFGNASITELQRRPDTGLLIARLNDCSHLKSGLPLVGDLEGSNRAV